MKIREIVKDDYPTVDAEQSVLAAGQTMLAKNYTGVVVLKNGIPSGVITERSLLRNLLPLDRKPSEVRCEEIMVPLLKVRSDLSVSEAAQIMVTNERTRLFVYEKGKLLGWVLLTDIVPYLVGRELTSLLKTHVTPTHERVMCPKCKSDFLRMATFDEGRSVRWECPTCGYTE
ncbi:MAG TPA: CBS domain-containing protein [Thermoplasmataceae archaeon]|nr:CBS domain-containing protein [Thermoplasmatales archaeon AK]HLH85810.1 CBS domain-containing protein [Thermoplasmataceae archaeon]